MTPRAHFAPTPCQLFRRQFLGVLAATLTLLDPALVAAQQTAANTQPAALSDADLRNILAGFQSWQREVATASYESSWINKPRPGGRNPAPTSVIVERTPRATALTLGTGSSARVILIDDAYTTNLSVGSAKRVVNPREMGLGQLAQYDPLTVLFTLPADMKNPSAKTVTLAEGLAAAGDTVKWVRISDSIVSATTPHWHVQLQAQRGSSWRLGKFDVRAAAGNGLTRTMDFDYSGTSAVPANMRESLSADGSETRLLREAKITPLTAKPFGEYPGPFRYTAEPGQVIDDYTGKAATNRAPARAPASR